MNVRAEFLVEPFNEGNPGPHVEAALATFEAAGCPVEVGPFGSSLTGEPSEILPWLAEAFDRALEAGASRVTLTVEAES